MPLWLSLGFLSKVYGIAGITKYSYPAEINIMRLLKAAAAHVDPYCFIHPTMTGGVKTSMCSYIYQHAARYFLQINVFLPTVSISYYSFVGAKKSSGNMCCSYLYFLKSNKSVYSTAETYANAAAINGVIGYKSLGFQC